MAYRQQIKEIQISKHGLNNLPTLDRVYHCLTESYRSISIIYVFMLFTTHRKINHWI